MRRAVPILGLCLVMVLGAKSMAGPLSVTPPGSFDHVPDSEKSVRSGSGVTRPVAELTASGAGSKKKDKKKKGEAAGTSLLPKADLKAIIANGKKHDVPIHEQNGEKCGLFALKMVMDYYHRKDPTNRNPPVDEGSPEEGEAIYEFALRTGRYWGKDGTTNPWHLSGIARGYDYKSCHEVCISGGSLDELRKDVMENNIPTIVSIRGLDADGNPVVNKMTGGHWVVVEGFYLHDGVEYMVVKHGTESDDVVWKVSDFKKAWNLGSKVCVWPKEAVSAAE